MKTKRPLKVKMLEDFGTPENMRIQAIACFADGKDTKLFAKGVVSKKDGVQQWYETTREHTYLTAIKYVSSARFTKVLKGKGAITKSKFTDWV